MSTTEAVLAEDKALKDLSSRQNMIIISVENLLPVLGGYFDVVSPIDGKVLLK